MKPFSKWTNPKNVGTSEYAYIYELMKDIRESNPGIGPRKLKAMQESSLRELRNTADSLLNEK